MVNIWVKNWEQNLNVLLPFMYWNPFPIIIQKFFNNKKQPYVYCMSLNNKKNDYLLLTPVLYRLKLQELQLKLAD